MSIDFDAMAKHLRENPAALQNFINEVPKEIMKDLTKTTSHASSGIKKVVDTTPQLRIQEKFDAYGEFSGHHLIVTNCKKLEGKKTFSVNSNGRSPKDNLIIAEEEAARLCKKYRLQRKE